LLLSSISIFKSIQRPGHPSCAQNCRRKCYIFSLYFHC